MKKIVIAILVFFVLSWISVVSAGDRHGKRGNWPGKRSPESTVLCTNDGLSIPSVPGTINREQCIPWLSECAPCIISLEDQGCKIVDVVVTHFWEDGQVVSLRTYLLSCDGR